MEIVFDNPLYLIFLLSIPLLFVTHFFTMRYLQRRALRFANFEAIRRVTGSDNVDVKNSMVLSRNLFMLIIRVMVILCLVLAAAGPTLWVMGRGSEIAYVIAVDASSSMLADDFSPSRLEAAKSAAASFIDSISGNVRLGVISFSGAAFVESQMSNDKRLAKDAIQNIAIKSIGGTDLSTAIITGANMLQKEDTAKAVILLTDGRHTVGPALDEGISYAQKNHVMVHTIGVATTQGGHFIKTDILSTLDEPALEAIASATGGRYFRAENPDALTASFKEISLINTQKVPIKLGPVFLLACLLCVFLEWGMVSTKFRTIP